MQCDHCQYCDGGGEGWGTCKGAGFKGEWSKGSLLYQQQAHANCMGGAKNANLHEQHVLMLFNPYSSPVMKIVMTHQRILKMITTGQ